MPTFSNSLRRFRRVPALVRVLGLGFVLALAVCLPTSSYATIKKTDRVDGVVWTRRGTPKGALPDVELKAGAVVTADGRVLWSRGENTQRAMASITKIMTAIVAIENSGPDAKVTIPPLVSVAGESSAGLKAGETMTRYELLEALLVKSGNDAALAVARIIAGSEEAFVQLMNDKAADLGLEHTHFENPHGLDQRGHYTSAADIATMARYAMNIDEFRQIVGKKSVKVKTAQGTHTLENTNILLQSYTGANGVKTGWTDDAGYCVVESAQRDGIELYAVVLGMPTDLGRFFAARDLLDFGFAHFRAQELATQGTVVGRAAVTNFPDRSVPVAFSVDVTSVVYDLSGEIERKLTIDRTVAPVTQGQTLGSATFVQGGKLVAKVPLVATETIEKPFLLVQWWYNLVKLWNYLF
ncbi:MAG: D-alanyl-D-alanine carboxypeptidase [Actinomycetes bacterium]|jgi:D-alanyl-D-alanine carboxypeptidase (penicillin-binding protein 5/6)|nr:D-alanyl-D-alanine carboxypeptidase [Actinomycetes bacterium]